MAMNPQNVLSQLRMMSDQQLQQYAAMHKNDPFIFPLAFQESQTRKQMRSESQAMQPPQPKVADQALAAMAAEPMPEEVGIGALPAKNLEGMAAGGIVAFDEGGEVPRFQNTGLVNSSLYATDPKLARFARLGAQGPGFMSRFAIPATIGLQGAELTAMAAEDLANMTPEQRAAYYRNPMVGALGGDASLAAAIMNAGVGPDRTGGSSSYLDQMKNVGKTLVGYPNMLATPPAPTPPTATSPVAAAVAAAAAAANVGNTPGTTGTSSADKSSAASTGGLGMRPGGGLGLTAIPALTQTGTGTMAELQAMREQMGGPTLSQSQQEGIAALAAEEKAAKEAGLKELEADVAARGPGMAGAEKRATERGERLSKRELELPGLAMFEAGMAMMAGESPYALVNIGKGAGLGMKSYIAGLEKLQESRDKLDESFDKIEQFRENRADMNAKEIRAAKADIRQTQVNAKRLAYDALSKNGEMDRQDVRTAYQALVSNRADAYKVAANYDLGLQQIAAQRDIASQRNTLYERLHGGDLKAREEFGRIQRAVMQSLDKNPLYTNEPNENKKAAMFNAAMQQAMQNNPYLAPAAFGLGFSKTPPPGAKEVFELPGAGG